MSRPVYETDLNLETERGFADDLERHTGNVFTKTAKLVAIDFAISDRNSGQLVGGGEIKCRTFYPGQYPTLNLSFHKWEALKQLSGTTHTFLYLRLLEADYMLPVTPTMSYSTKTWGRRDRGDDQDIEKAVILPMTIFIRLQLPGWTIPPAWEQYVHDKQSIRGSGH